MAEFTYNPIQEVNPNQPVILNTTIGCNKGYVLHRNESGIVTLRGIVNNSCSAYARYQVIANGNIAIPTGETVGPIAIAIAIDGEPVLTSTTISTPTVVNSYASVTSIASVTVPRGCCFNVSIENVSDIPINIQNATVIVTRTA